MMPGQFLRLLLFGFIFILPSIGSGQYYSIGQDPASLKWRQIITSKFRIVYPENFEQQAQKMIPTLDYVYKYGTKTLDYKPKPIPVIVHNLTTESNALTVWAPKRIELYTCPPQDSYAQNWLEQLIIHEYRHVVQLDRTNQGFTKGLSFLLGEQAAAIVNGIFVPSWFMEGDAVCAETLLSKSGRGRIPGFERPLRTQVLQKKPFSYDKAAFGSYKSFVPNQYALGYTLVANVRKKYGYNTWVKALDEVARKPYRVTPFNHGLKKATGFGKEQLYQTAMIDMDSMWRFQDSMTVKTEFRLLTSQTGNRYINFKFPLFLNDTLIIAQLSGLDDITRFVVLGPCGYKKTIVTPGFLSSEFYSCVNLSALTRNDLGSGYAAPGYLLAWTETINDHRWEQRNYSVIRIYDSRTQKTRSLTKQSRYFSPSISPDGKTIVAVSMSPTNQCSLVLMDIESGNEIATIVTSETDFYMTPKWSEDGNRVVYTKLDNEGKSIVIFDSKKLNFRTIVQPTFTEISNPVFARGVVLFNGSFSGIENIYAYDFNKSEILQVTSARFGACDVNLSPDREQIIYSDYSADGYRIVEAGFNPDSWKVLREIKDFSPSLYKHLLNEETQEPNDVKSDIAEYKSKTYNKLTHIFKFHSWAPAYINYLAGENGTGISFMSQNDLSTAITVLGYKYDMAENTGKITADFSYKAWYPLIDISTSYGARAAYTDSSVRYNFNEAILSGGFTIPLVFNSGKYYEGLRLRVHSSFYHITENTSPKEKKLSGTIHSIDYSLNAYRFIKQSVKDLYPRWGQALTVSYRHSPFGDNNLGSVFSTAARLYFPGFGMHHGFRIDLNIQNRKPGEYSYSNQVVLPRGYSLIDEKSLVCYAVNYKFPFAYPDLAIGPIVYLKRLKANLFFDGGRGTTHGLARNLQSTGVEITSDLHFLRFIFPLDIGFRLGYRPLEKQYFTDILFSVNLSN